MIHLLPSHTDKLAPWAWITSATNELNRTSARCVCLHAPEGEIEVTSIIPTFAKVIAISASADLEFSGAVKRLELERPLSDLVYLANPANAQVAAETPGLLVSRRVTGEALIRRIEREEAQIAIAYLWITASLAG